MASIKIKRGTRAQLLAAGAADGLKVGEPYLITDDNRLAVGLSDNDFAESAMLGASQTFTGDNIFSQPTQQAVSAVVPSAAATGFLKRFVIALAGKVYQSFIDNEGNVFINQPHIGLKKIAFAFAEGNAGVMPATYGFRFTTPVGTVASRSPAFTANKHTLMRRNGLVSAATAGSLAHVRTGSGTTGWAMWATGNGSQGGFNFIKRFNISDATLVSGARMFIGMIADTAAPTNVEPSSLVNCLGIAQLSTDATQLYIVSGGSSANAPIALGATDFPVSNTIAYELHIDAPKIGGKWRYRVTNLQTDVSVEGEIAGGTAVVPAISTLLGFSAWRSNNATAQAVAIDFNTIYIQSDF